MEEDSLEVCEEKPTSPMDNALEELRKAKGTTAEIVNVLEHRLKSVLGNELPKDADKDVAAKTSVNNLVEKIHIETAGIKYINSRIKSILDRLLV